MAKNEIPVEISQALGNVKAARKVLLRRLYQTGGLRTYGPAGTDNDDIRCIRAKLLVAEDALLALEMDFETRS